MKSLFDLEKANLAVVKSISSLKLGTKQLNLHNLYLHCTGGGDFSSAKLND